jgi:hypothetical protein
MSKNSPNPNLELNPKHKSKSKLETKKGPLVRITKGRVRDDITNQKDD